MSKLLKTKKSAWRSYFRLGVFIVALVMIIGAINHNGSSVASAAETTAGQDSEQLLQIDWGKELKAGGNTAIALGVLSVFGVLIIIERLISLLLLSFAPGSLRFTLIDLARNRDYDGFLETCEMSNSALAEASQFIVENRHEPYDLVSTAAGDIASRSVRKHLSRTQLLGAVAALAPLLGLLGTMIGMIEAFKLVEVFGDESGATMLAGSISKALITTAVGLILAIPALAMYHLFKHILSAKASDLELAIEEVIGEFYFGGSKPQAVKVAGAKPSPRPVAAPKPVPAPAPKPVSAPKPVAAPKPNPKPKSEG